MCLLLPDTSGIQELPVSAHHVAEVAKLRQHHSDPIDRLLLAQAFLEPLRFVTADPVLAAYGGNRTSIAIKYANRPAYESAGTAAKFGHWRGVTRHVPRTLQRAHPAATMIDKPSSR
jgi:hypothetical protein